MRSTLLDWEAELARWLKPFLDRLGHKARRRMCPLYVTGLIGPGDRKSIQPMAERLVPGNYDQLHPFCRCWCLGRNIVRERTARSSRHETLAATCPKSASASVHESLEVLSRTLDALAASLATLRPAFGTFSSICHRGSGKRAWPGSALTLQEPPVQVTLPLLRRNGLYAE
jgi:DDE superfamily endonuclease